MRSNDGQSRPLVDFSGNDMSVMHMRRGFYKNTSVGLFHREGSSGRFFSGRTDFLRVVCVAFVPGGLNR